MDEARHFDRVADAYDRARPPYPPELYDALPLAAGTRVLEIGAGSGLATAELVARGARVTAVEPGAGLAAILRRALPEVDVVVAAAEVAPLPSEVDLVVAATALHWVDADVVLPRLHAALRPGGTLAVWWTVFGDPDVSTPFRRAVDRIAGAAGIGARTTPRPLRFDERLAELAAGGLFEPEQPTVHRWTTTSTTAQLRDLFATFPRWTPSLVDQVAAAADAEGGSVQEHYVTVLYRCRRVTPPVR